MDDFYETWKGIAYKLQRSERWCRYMSRRMRDPLPVFKLGGIVRLNGSDLSDWLLRQRASGLSAHNAVVNLQRRVCSLMN